MRFMIMIKGNAQSEKGVLPSEKFIEAMGKYNEEMVKAGVLLAGEGLHPTSKGAKLTFSRGRRTVIDGPFSEAKELVAGYWLIQVSSKAEAIEWAKRIPFEASPEANTDQVAEVEIRQVAELSDFPQDIPAVQQEVQLRAQVEQRKNG